MGSIDDRLKDFIECNQKDTGGVQYLGFHKILCQVIDKGISAGQQKAFMRVYSSIVRGGLRRKCGAYLERIEHNGKSRLVLPAENLKPFIDQLCSDLGVDKEDALNRPWKGETRRHKGKRKKAEKSTKGTEAPSQNKHPAKHMNRSKLEMLKKFYYSFSVLEKEDIDTVLKNISEEFNISYPDKALFTEKALELYFSKPADERKYCTMQESRNYLRKNLEFMQGTGIGELKSRYERVKLKSGGRMFVTKKSLDLIVKSETEKYMKQNKEMDFIDAVYFLREKDASLTGRMISEIVSGTPFLFRDCQKKYTPAMLVKQLGFWLKRNVPNLDRYMLLDDAVGDLRGKFNISRHDALKLLRSLDTFRPYGRIDRYRRGDVENISPVSQDEEGWVDEGGFISLDNLRQFVSNENPYLNPDEVTNLLAGIRHVPGGMGMRYSADEVYAALKNLPTELSDKIVERVKYCVPFERLTEYLDQRFKKHAVMSPRLRAEARKGKLFMGMDIPKDLYIRENGSLSFSRATFHYLKDIMDYPLSLIPEYSPPTVFRAGGEYAGIAEAADYLDLGVSGIGLLVEGGHLKSREFENSMTMVLFDDLIRVKASLTSRGVRVQ